MAVAHKVKDFGRDEGGAISVVFIIALMVTICIAGAAIDIGFACIARTRLQFATDSGALAAASTSLPKTADRTAIATAAFNANVYQSDLKTITPVVAASTNGITVAATYSYPTIFMRLLRVEHLNIVTKATAQASAGNLVEISLMLDLTGSMGSDDGTGRTKMAALKSAATELVDLLLPDSGTTSARVALAPFAPTVKLEDAYLEAATGLPLTKSVCTQTGPVCENTTCASYWSNGSCRRWNQSCTTQCTQTSTTYLRRCVTERTGTAQFTDAAPGTGTYVTAYVPSGSSDAYASTLTKARNCTPQETVVPLTSDKTILKATIDAFDASGSTAGALGTAWAWYLLSPEWASLYPVASQPRAYGYDTLRKIAVLMTDGTYNTEAGRSYSDGSADATRISGNANSLCTGMKSKGIEVYTVGFKLDNDLARQTLSNCASGPTFYFLAENGEQLSAAFREIARRAIAMRLTE